MCALASAEIKHIIFPTSGGRYQILFVFASVWEPKQRTLPRQCDQPDSLNIALWCLKGAYIKRGTTF